MQDYTLDHPIELLTIAGHGSGSDVYVGNDKISSEPNGTAIIASELPTLGVFLDTCYGFKWDVAPDHPTTKALWQEFCVGPTRFIVAYWGIKDNSTLECDWNVISSHPL
ncbi:MAG: hypothetical protein M1499_07310 [Firmicutes bacterium]|nr:hypothetical protein [Bacillota bacterium]